MVIWHLVSAANRLYLRAFLPILPIIVALYCFYPRVYQNSMMSTLSPTLTLLLILLLTRALYQIFSYQPLKYQEIFKLLAVRLLSTLGGIFSLLVLPGLLLLGWFGVWWLLIKLGQSRYLPFSISLAMLSILLVNNYYRFTLFLIINHHCDIEKAINLSKGLAKQRFALTLLFSLMSVLLLAVGWLVTQSFVRWLTPVWLALYLPWHLSFWIIWTERCYKLRDDVTASAVR